MPRLTKLSRSIAGHTALVTGAASGMGRATAQLFADEGARVAVLDRNGDGVESVVQEIVQAGGTARGWSVDLMDEDRIAPVVADIAAHFGGLDILVNNAGIDAGVRIHSSRYEEVLGALFSGEPGRPPPSHSGRPAPPDQKQSGPDCEYRLNRGRGRQCLCQPVYGRQTQGLLA